MQRRLGRGRVDGLAGVRAAALGSAVASSIKVSWLVSPWQPVPERKVVVRVSTFS